MNCPQRDERIHRKMAKRLAADIVLASHLGKTAVRGRELAYQKKAQKLSIALLKFAQFFKLVAAERNPAFGVLLSIKLNPIRRLCRQQVRRPRTLANLLGP